MSNDFAIAKSAISALDARHLYPNPPVLTSFDSLPSKYANQSDLLAVEIFQSPPGELLDTEFNQIRICINRGLSPVDIYIEHNNETVFEGLLHTHEAIFMAANFNSDWKWNTHADCVVISVDPKFLENLAESADGLLQDGFQKFHGIRRLLSTSLAKSAERIAACISQQKAAHWVSYDSLKNIVGMQILRALCSDIKSYNGEQENLGVISFAVDLIRKDLSRRVTVSELAFATGLGQKSFTRLFKQKCGISPSKFALIERVSYAIGLIQDGMDFSAVSYHSGFCDQSHMNRCIKQVTGQTPSELRLLAEPHGN